MTAQSIAFPALGHRTVGDADFAANASASSGLPVIYPSTNPGVATIDSATGRIHALHAGATVTTSAGTSATDPGARFTYVPAPTITGLSASTGPMAGGTAVVISGKDFVEVTSVKFGGIPALDFVVESIDRIRATSPAGFGIAQVTVTTAFGTSLDSASFRYDSPEPGLGPGVVTWGYNYLDQLGYRTANIASPDPCAVSATLRVRAAAAGADHTSLLQDDGRVILWGQLRTDPGLTNVVDISAAGYHTMALKKDGTVWALGQNDFGELGDGTSTDASTAVRARGLPLVKAIAAGYSNSMALAEDGTVWAWGYNGYGVLGDRSVLSFKSPVRIAGLSAVQAMASGLTHMVALKEDGTVWTWGHDSHGQLGPGATAVPASTPRQVSGLTGVKAIAAGAWHTVALKEDGTVVTWGWNAAGQVGDTTLVDRSPPFVVPGLSDVKAISAGKQQTVALTRDGSVWVWGENGLGQLGDGTTSPRRGPVRVPGLSYVTSIAAGADHTIVLVAPPIAPTRVTALAGDREATVSFSTGVEGGPTLYTVTSSPDGVKATGLASPITVKGLVNGTTYTFTVTATNPWTTSAASEPSNGVTPQAPQSITFPEISATYGEADFDPGATASSLLPVLYVSHDPAVATISAEGMIHLTAAGTATIAAYQPGNAAFRPADTVRQVLMVHAKRLSVAGVRALSKVFDGTIAADFDTTPGQPVLPGVVAGDTVSLVLGPASFDTRDAGTAKVVRVAGARLAGADAGNYELAEISALHADIETRRLSVLADSLRKSQGAADPALTYRVEGLVGSDTLMGALSREPGDTPGAYAIYQGTLSAGANYALSFTGAVLRIESGPVALSPRPGRASPQACSARLSQDFAAAATGNGTAALATREGGCTPASCQSLELALPGPASVQVAIYDRLGAPVISWSESFDARALRGLSKGRVRLWWNLRAQNGVAVAPGVYLWHVKARAQNGRELDTVLRTGVR